MNLIMTDERRPGPGPALLHALSALDKETRYLAADKLDTRPCTACGSCSGKTFGRCVLADDMQKVLPLLVRCSRLVLVTPVIFGGPGFNIKKVIDRMTAVGDPRYYLKNGELVKGMTGKGFRYHLVGVGDTLSMAEREAFRNLHRENCRIMGTEGLVFLLDSQADKAQVDKLAEVIGHG